MILQRISCTIIISILTWVASVNAAPHGLQQDEVTHSAAAAGRRQTHQHKSRKFTGLLYSLGEYRRRLQEQGLINSIDEHLFDSSEAGYTHFNELEMLQLIPVIISELQARRVSFTDQVMLRAVFGSLWPLMVDEADRRKRRRAAVRSVDGGGGDGVVSGQPQPQHIQPIDPVLKSILRAQRDVVFERESAFMRHSNNNNNAAIGVGVGDAHSMAAKLAKLWVDHNEHNDVEPSQRILKLAAVLIHEQMQRKQHRAQRKSLRRQEAAVLRLTIAGARRKRSLASGDSTGDSNAAEGNDEDYSYDDAADETPPYNSGDLKDMFEDDNGGTGNGIGTRVTGAVDGDGDYVDPTILALRGDDEQLLREMYGSVAQRNREYLA